MISRTTNQIRGFQTTNRNLLFFVFQKPAFGFITQIVHGAYYVQECVLFGISTPLCNCYKFVGFSSARQIQREEFVDKEEAIQPKGKKNQSDALWECSVPIASVNILREVCYSIRESSPVVAECFIAVC